MIKGIAKEDGTIILDFDELSFYIQELQQENKQLKEKIDKAIEYIKELYIAEYDGNSYYIKDKNNNELGIEDIGKNILEILGDKENE